MGFVRWESGASAVKSTVILQHSGNFRIFLKRLETDGNGFFRTAGVPGDQPYFAFALPPGEDSALREYSYFGVESRLREAWRDLTIHSHRITGRFASADLPANLQLVHSESGVDRVLLDIRNRRFRPFLGRQHPARVLSGADATGRRLQNRTIAAIRGG